MCICASVVYLNVLVCVLTYVDVCGSLKITLECLPQVLLIFEPLSVMENRVLFFWIDLLFTEIIHFTYLSPIVILLTSFQACLFTQLLLFFSQFLMLLFFTLHYSLASLPLSCLLNLITHVLILTSFQCTHEIYSTSFQTFLKAKIFIISLSPLFVFYVL